MMLVVVAVLFPLVAFAVVYWLAGSAWGFNQLAMPLAAVLSALVGATVTYVANRKLADRNQTLNKELESLKASLKTKGEREIERLKAKLQREEAVFDSRFEAVRGLHAMRRAN